MTFLNDERRFKAVARAIADFCRQNRNIESTDLEKLLEPLASKLPYGLHKTANSLAASLNASPARRFSLASIQQALAQASAGRTFQRLKRSFIPPLSFRQLFSPDFLPPTGLSDKVTTRYPFPEQLLKFPELEAWRDSWERDCRTSGASMFFPPAIPKTCFSKTRVTFDLYADWPTKQSWAINADPRQLAQVYQNGKCGLIARDNKGQVRGTVKWTWWGSFGLIHAVGFYALVPIPGGHLSIIFDIRPYQSTPMFGLMIEKIDIIRPHANDIKLAEQEIRALKRKITPNV